MSASRRPNPVWLFDDIDGNILDDTYYAHFLKNEIPYLPQDVFQDSAGVTQWANPLQFNANGTLPNNLYFTDGAVYRIEIRQGPLQSDPLVGDPIENFTGEGSDSPSGFAFPTDNQITNPQFVDVNFDSNGLQFVNTGTNTHTIAPAWDLILVGSATMTVTRLDLNADDNINGNPPFALRLVVSAGTFTSVTLRQRFENAPGIWSGQYVSASLAARSNDANRLFSVTYNQNDGYNETLISDTMIDGAFNTFQGHKFIELSNNPSSGDDGYVDILYSLPLLGSYDLTNIQIIGSDFELDYIYSQVTPARQIDQTFNVYENSLVTQQKNSILVGWNFGLNPWQFRATALSNVPDNRYTADQTIIVQQAYVSSATGNNVAVGRATHDTDNYTYQVSAVTTTNQFALIQYIDPKTARPYWGKTLSSMVQVFINSILANNSSIQFKLRLFYKSGLPNAIGQNDPITSWASGSDPVMQANYTLLVPPNDPVYSVTRANTSGNPTQMKFEGIQLPESNNANMTLGIMVYTISDMAITTTPDILFFKDISLTRNDFAIETQCQTFDEVLSQCQYYYETSYDIGATPGVTTSSNGALYRNQLANEAFSLIGFVPRPFGIEFNTIKSIEPYTVSIYPTGAATGDTVQIHLTNGGVSFHTNTISFSGRWAPANLGLKNATFVCVNATVQDPTGPGVPFSSPGAYIEFHYAIDARLGITH